MKTHTAVRPVASPPGSRPARPRRSWWGPLFALPHSSGLVVFVVIPAGMALVMSLYSWPLLGEISFLGIDNYTRILSDPIFRVAVVNTVVYVLGFTVLNVLVALGLAAWLSPRIRGRHVFRVIFFIPAVTPIVANVVVWRLIYQPGGLLDQAAAPVMGDESLDVLNQSELAMLAIIVMSVWQGFGYNMLVFSAALDAVPESLIEAARIDGASAWQTFWRVRFPMIGPAVFFGVTMTLISSFQVFIQPFILTRGGPGSSTMTLVLYLYQSGFGNQNLGLAAAAGTIILVIILLVTAAQFAGEKKWVNYD
ncbi:carbohydrate ABC transporter permease [Jiangella alba]|uniref:Multiple sugar transport system permease protein n=1 Tax=Jiangella alba TaxID=561176 RepID=A0A1H5JE48_9ACTN|nr:sugar ABC transporter permease [Jiangella alba]SEE50281.1 multiple sugar transport system permease protein [Jiangella alba]